MIAGKLRICPNVKLLACSTFAQTSRSLTLRGTSNDDPPTEATAPRVITAHPAAISLGTLGDLCNAIKQT